MKNFYKIIMLAFFLVGVGLNESYGQLTWLHESDTVLVDQPSTGTGEHGGANTYDLLYANVLFSNLGTNGVVTSVDWPGVYLGSSLWLKDKAYAGETYSGFYEFQYDNDELESYTFWVFFNEMYTIKETMFIDGDIATCSSTKLYPRTIISDPDYRFLKFSEDLFSGRFSTEASANGDDYDGVDVDGNYYIDGGLISDLDIRIRNWSFDMVGEGTKETVSVQVGGSGYADLTRTLITEEILTVFEDDFAICSTETSRVVTMNRSDGTWSPGGTIDDVTGEFNPSLLASGVHSFDYTTNNSLGTCLSVATIEITINDELLAEAGDDTAYCIYDGGVEKTTLDLSTEIPNHTPQADGVWTSADNNSTINGALSGTTLELDFWPLGASYTLRYTRTTGEGCVDYDDVILSFGDFANGYITVVNASDNYACAESSFDLEINPSAGFTFEWFDSAIGGISLETGLTYTTNVLSSTTTFYVEGTNTTAGCNTQRKPIQVTIENNPYGTNTYVAITNAQSCEASDALTISALTARTGYEFIWYDAETNGNELFTGGDYSPGMVTETTSYWVEGHHIEKGCRSPRKEVTITISGAPTVVAGDDVVLCAAEAYVLNDGSESPAGGTYSGTGVVGDIFDPFGLDPDDYNITYYYEDAWGCSNSDIRVVTITEPVVLSIFPTQNHCLYVSGEKESSYDLTLFSPSPSGGAWSTLDGDVTVIDNTLDLSGINSSGGVTGEKLITLTYTYSDPNSCEFSEDVSLTVRTQAASEVIADDEVICGAGEVVLTAENVSGNSSATIGWFDSETGGASIETGTTLTRSIPITTSYWVALRSNGCYGERKEVVATVNDIEIADGGSLVVLCLATDTYDLNTGANTYPGGVGVWTGDGVVGGTSTFDAALVAFGQTHEATYTWYGENGCESSDTRLIQVGAQDALFGNEDVDIALYQDNDRVNNFDLDALNPSPIGGTFKVTYLDAGRGEFAIDEATNEVNFLGMDESKMSQILTVTYSVGDGNGCDSEVTTTLIVHTLSKNDFVINSGDACGEGEISLSMASPQVLTNEATHEVVWFGSENGTDEVTTGYSYVTPNLTESKTYYVAAAVKGTNLYGPRVAIVAVINPLPLVDAGQNTTFCDVNGGTLDLSIAASPKGGLFTGSGMMADGKTFDSFLAGEGEHIITYTVVDSETLCENTAQITITVGLNEEVAGAGESISECFGGTSITLNPETTGGTWTSDDSLIRSRINNSTSSVNVTGVSPGQYNLTYERVNSGGCTLEETITLDILSPPSTALPEDAYVCGSGASEVRASGSSGTEVIQWFNDINDVVPIFRGNIYTTPILSTTTVYYVNIKNDSGCESEKVEVRVNVNTTPLTVSIGADLTFCTDNMSYDLFQDASKLGGEFSGIGVVDNKFVGGNGSGSFLVTYVVYDDATHCEATDTRTINVGIVPELSTDVDVMVASEPVRFETNLTNIVSIKWDFGDGIESEELKPYHYYYLTGQYTVRLDLVLNNGCSGSYVFENYANVTGSDIDVVTADIEGLETKIVLYPNPVVDHLTAVLPFESGQDIVIEVFTLYGRRIVWKEMKYNASGSVLLDNKDLNYFSKGQYIIKVNGGTTPIISRFNMK